MTVGARRNVICKPVCGVFVHCTWTCTCDLLCACSFVWHLSMFSQLKPGTCNFIRSSLASIFFLNGDFLLKIEGSLLCIQREKETFHFSTQPLFTPSRENMFCSRSKLRSQASFTHEALRTHVENILLTTSPRLCPISPHSPSGKTADVLMSPLLLTTSIPTQLIGPGELYVFLCFMFHSLSFVGGQPSYSQ